MSANHKFAHFDNVRERKADRLAEEVKAAKPTKAKKSKKKVEEKDES